ncbi:MAG: hypothetical protein ACYCX2_11925 [Christensenellales bacterium]
MKQNEKSCGCNSIARRGMVKWIMRTDGYTAHEGKPSRRAQDFRDSETTGTKRERRLFLKRDKIKEKSKRYEEGSRLRDNPYRGESGKSTEQGGKNAAINREAAKRWGVQ